MSNRKYTDGIVSPEFFVVAGICVLFFGVGAALGWVGHAQGDTQRPLRASGYTFTRPLLLCNIDNLSQNEDTGLTSALSNYIVHAQNKDISIYYLNPTVGKWSGIKENESFSPASMLKVPLMVAVMHSIPRAQITTTRVTYDGSFDDNGLETIQPQEALKAGYSYTIEELLRYMIVDSDNNAAHLLHDLLTQKQFETIYTDLGIAAPTASGPTDFMSPKTFALFLRLLYNGTYLSHANSDRALDLMSQSNFADGLRAGVPADITVAEKFGEREQTGQPTELHDCGVVYYNQDGAYMLCVMTRGNDTESLSKEIADISKLVYDHVIK